MRQTLKHWSDIQITYLVAKHGTLSGAAAELEVHHSTILRRIDAIEARLGRTLFHRHARGYTPTESGQLLFAEAQLTEQRLERLMGKLVAQDQALSGPLIITTVGTFSAILLPIIAKFSSLYPNVQVELNANPRIFKLEYGEAHVSIRPGKQPIDPDYVVQALPVGGSTLYGSSDYIKLYGTMASLKHFQGHQFLNLNTQMNNIASIRWINETVHENNISFKGSDFNILIDAAKNNLGLVPLSVEVGERSDGLIAMMPPPKEWKTDLWLVTHRDLHRSPKVMAFTALLKQEW
jgi:DNA-binding transcriptional LysR family regulator